MAFTLPVGFDVVDGLLPEPPHAISNGNTDNAAHSKIMLDLFIRAPLDSVRQLDFQAPEGKVLVNFW
jgi:hypothetical protein